MKPYEALFIRKLQEWEGLIKFASRRYSVPGVLDPEDLYQESLIILDNMFRKYDFEPDSDDFRKMFKTELWHGLWHVLQRTKASKRDWKRLVPKDYSDMENESTCGDRDVAPGHVMSTDNPELAYAEKEAHEAVDKLIDLLVERLDDEAKVILNEMLHPRSWDDIPEEFKFTGREEVYWRTPKHIPQHTIAEVLGWPLIRVRRAAKRVRRQAKALGEELGLDILAAVEFQRRADAEG